MHAICLTYCNGQFPLTVRRDKVTAIIGREDGTCDVFFEGNADGVTVDQNHDEVYSSWVEGFPKK